MIWINRHISIFLQMLGWVYAPQTAVDKKALKCYGDGYVHGIKVGQDIGMVKVLRHIKTNDWETSAAAELLAPEMVEKLSARIRELNKPDDKEKSVIITPH